MQRQYLTGRSRQHTSGLPVATFAVSNGNVACKACNVVRMGKMQDTLEVVQLEAVINGCVSPTRAGRG
jgi:hypothetical protein